MFIEGLHGCKNGWIMTRSSMRIVLLFAAIMLSVLSINAISQEILFSKTLTDGRKIELSCHEVPVGPSKITEEDKRYVQLQGGRFESPKKGFLNSFKIVSANGRETNEIWSVRSYAFEIDPGLIRVLDAAAQSNDLVVVYEHFLRLYANVITTLTNGQHTSMPPKQAKLILTQFLSPRGGVISARIEGTLQDKNLTVVVFDANTEIYRFRLTETQTGKTWVADRPIPSGLQP